MMATVTYLGSGGKVGETITAEATCDKCKGNKPMSLYLTDILIPLAVGRNLAYTTVIFKNAQGEITARGSHTK